jgi:adhesin/invasin
MLAPMAHAAPACQGTFVYAGSEQTCTVAAGVRKLSIQAVGGGGGASEAFAGGTGAAVQAVIAVTPGETLYIEVGGDGHGSMSGNTPTDGAGGWNGGGNAVNTPYAFDAGGGGGASDVRTISCGGQCPGSAQSQGSRLLVAGGGGGSGSGDLFEPYAEGGGGGNADAAGHASQDNGGTGGQPGMFYGPGTGGSTLCGIGASGSGASGGSDGAGGGGGGGGAYGGGAGYPNCSGGGGAGGGGGASYVPPGGQRLGLAGGAEVTMTPGVPTATVPPTISGTPLEGQTLTEAHANWAVTVASFAYQWWRCDAQGLNCVPIPGATGAAYVLGAADVGASLTVTEVASNDWGDSAPVSSAATAPVANGVPAVVAAPVIAGPAVAGQTLSLQRGTWTNGPSSYTEQWLRCDAHGGQCQPIPGGTAMSYRVGAQDVGGTLRVQESAANPLGTGAPALTAASAQIKNAQLTLQTFALVGTVRAVVPGPLAAFQDPTGGLAAGAYTATISWGDHSSTKGTVVAGKSGSFLIDGEHAYLHSGNYTLTVSVDGATGASAASANRVTVFAADVCPKHVGATSHNCIGDVELPSGCVAPGAKLRVSIPAASNIAGVTYTIGGAGGRTRGRGRTFAAALPTQGLSGGTHHLSAHIRFRSGRPRVLVKTRPFAVCAVLGVT